MSATPTEPGGFVGDIYYGDPERPTFGTHRWNGSEWMALASEAEALTMLLGSARARIADLTAKLTEARDDALEEAASLPVTIIPHSPELKAAHDAVRGYQAAIRNLKGTP